MNHDAIKDGVCQCLAVVLEIDAATIKTEDKIINDLGADSLDLLDLIFQLERHFGLRIKPRDLERRAQEALGNIPLEVEGVYTPKALEQLRRSMPEVPPEEMADGLRMSRLPYLFRVQTFINLVERLTLEQKPA